jgi:DNA-binding XRE family transcriptional regulator
MKPKPLDPLARKLTALRLAREETQAQFAEHFSVGRTTILNWETYGPPRYGPVRLWCEHIMKRLMTKPHGRP